MKSSGNVTDIETYDLELDIPLIPELDVALPVQTIDNTLFNVDDFSDDDPNLPARREPVTPWPAKLPFDLALGVEPPEQIFLRYNISPEEYQSWVKTIAFRRALAEASKTVGEQGLSFKVLCQGIAHDFLSVIDTHLHDESTGFSTRMDAFKTVTRLAGLEPKTEKTDAGDSKMVNIQINL